MRRASLLRSSFRRFENSRNVEVPHRLDRILEDAFSPFALPRTRHFSPRRMNSNRVPLSSPLLQKPVISTLTSVMISAWPASPFPENDLWIAALARQHELPVLTNDAHFDQVSGLERIGW